MDPVEYESFGTSLAGPDWTAVESAALRGETIRCEIEKGRTYRVTVEPWRAGTVDVSGTAGVAIDQTERLGLEDQIEVLNRELMRARSNDPEPGLRSEEVMEFGELRVDPAAAKVVVRGQMVHLTPIEFKLLLLLARNAERVLSHQVLLRRVWGYEFLGSGSLIPMAISRLRMKIERDPSNPSLITTVRGSATASIQKGLTDDSEDCHPITRALVARRVLFRRNCDRCRSPQSLRHGGYVGGSA